MNLLTLDTETTGVDPTEARLVTAFVGLMNQGGGFDHSLNWLVDPGIEIPEGAAAVHGITTERARAEGGSPASALREIAHILDYETRRGTPVVIYNAPYDLTLLRAEIARHTPELVESFEETLGRMIVIDPLVIDKALDKYRKGSRKLVDTAAQYGVPVEVNAHDAGADCLMAGRVAIRLLQTSAAGYTLPQLHEAQVGWKREQAASLESYFRYKAPAEKRDPNATVNRGWPVQS